MRILLSAGSLFLALVPLAAEARMHAPYRGHRIVSSTLPLDGAGSFAATAEAYSLRKLKSTYSGPGIKLRRATGGTQDINFVGFVPGRGAPIDVAAANAFCAETNCFFDTWYDQSGNARHAVQATAANQPQYIADCIGTLPCARATGPGGSVALTTAGTYGSPTGTGTYGSVGRRQSGPYYCYQLQGYVGGTGTGMQLGINYGSDQWFIGGSAHTFSSDPTGTANWHAVVGTAGPGSVIRVDATETAGAGAGTATTGGRVTVSAAYPDMACDTAEAIHWDGYIMPQAERAALTANQKTFWGF